jgi:hypothetical protein
LDEGRGENDFQFLGFLVHGPGVDNAVVDGVISLPIIEGSLEEDVDRFPAFEAVFQTVIPLGINEETAIPDHLVPGHAEFLGIFVSLTLEQKIKQENRISLYRNLVAGPVFIPFEVFPNIAVRVNLRKPVILKPKRVFEKVDVMLHQILGHKPTSEYWGWGTVNRPGGKKYWYFLR